MIAEGLVEYLQATAPQWATKLTRERLAFASLTMKIGLVYRKGWARGMKDYAVWKDGEQLVGVMQRPLQGVLDVGPDQMRMETDLDEVLNPEKPNE